MPLPNAWAQGVAAPSFTNPYASLEGGGPLGVAGGEVGVGVAPASKAHVSEILDWKGSPAIWLLLAILLVIGVMHFKGGARAKLGKATAGAGIEV